MKLLLLDFDGVINALSGSTRGDKQVWPKWENTTLDGFPILYSPNVVTAINHISEQEDINVKWLTTWQEDTTLFSSLGFKTFDSIIHDAQDVIYGHWKIDMALQQAPDYETVVWCEDETLIHNLAKDKVTAFIKTTSEVGLSKRNIKRICYELDVPWEDMLGLL